MKSIKLKKIISLTIIAAFVSCFVFASTSPKHSSKAFEAGTATMMSVGAMGGARSMYEKLKTKYGENRVIAPSFLRSEALLQNGSQEYTFNLRLLGNESATEHKLNEQDLFAASRVGLFLMAENIAVAGISSLQTYPNPVVFPDEAGQLLTAHLEHIYNGYINIKVGDTNYLPDLPIFGTRVVNTTQKSADNANSERHQMDGFIDLTPTVSFKGRENNELRLRVPGNANQKVQSVAGTYKAKVVLILLGYKVTGAGQ